MVADYPSNILCLNHSLLLAVDIARFHGSKIINLTFNLRSMQLLCIMSQRANNAIPVMDLVFAGRTIRGDIHLNCAHCRRIDPSRKRSCTTLDL